MSKEKRIPGYCEYCGNKLGSITIHRNLLVEEIFCDMKCLELFEEKERVKRKIGKNSLSEKVQNIYKELSYIIYYTSEGNSLRVKELFKMVYDLRVEIRDNKIEFKK